MRWDGLGGSNVKGREGVARERWKRSRGKQGRRRYTDKKENKIFLIY